MRSKYIEAKRAIFWAKHWALRVVLETILLSSIFGIIIFMFMFLRKI